MHSRVLKSLGQIAVLAMVALLPVALVAQAAPAAKGPADSNPPSRWDIFAGYSYLYLPPSTQVNGTPYQSLDFGGMGGVSRYFNKNVGLEWEMFANPRQDGSNDGFWGGRTGMIFRFPTETGLTPWVHGLIGFDHVGGPDQQANFGAAATFGGGLDLPTHLMNGRVAWRIVQGDYSYSHVNFGVNGRGSFNQIRLTDGLVFHLGSVVPPPPVTLTCSITPAAPTTIYPGDPITVTATAGSLDPKLTASYVWAGTGVTGNGTTATVATGALEPGNYTVKATVMETKPGKSGGLGCPLCGGGATGLKAGQVADCSASYTVKPFEPPTLSCSANPSTIKPGESSTITSIGVSPQNRPLTYSYSATAGTVSGSGTTATYNSAGAPTGAVGITCTVNDDKGHTVTANTSVTITQPYVPPPPPTQALCNITFDKDKLRPTRVDNEAKACLDQVALDLQNQANATAVVVGESDQKEKDKLAKQEKYAEKHKHAKVEEDPAALRAVNTKEYLVTEKGIDASRISTATGTTDGKTVENYLVPSGATFTNDIHGTTPVDETKVKAVVRKPLPNRKHIPRRKSTGSTGPGGNPSVKPPQ